MPHPVIDPESIIKVEFVCSAETPREKRRTIGVVQGTTIQDIVEQYGLSLGVVKGYVVFMGGKKVHPLTQILSKTSDTFVDFRNPFKDPPHVKISCGVGTPNEKHSEINVPAGMRISEIIGKFGARVGAKPGCRILIEGILTEPDESVFHDTAIEFVNNGFSSIHKADSSEESTLKGGKGGTDEN